MSVPSNLVPTRILQLPEDPAPSSTAYMMYVNNGVTYKVQVSAVLNVSGVPTTRAVIAGTGLTGGGALSSNITISVAPGGIGASQLNNTGVTAGVYGDASNFPVLTVDANGRVTAATTLPVPLTTGYVPTSRQIIAGAGLSGGGNLTADVTLTNSAPDRVVSLTNGTGISTSGTYPNFTITNSLPDQVVSLAGAGTTTVTGTYPNFTITSSGGTVYPGAGIPNSTGSAWGTSYDVTGTNRVVLNTSPMLSGNVGIGLTGSTPIAWTSLYNSLQVGSSGSISNPVTGSEMSVSSNLKYQTTYKYVNNGAATRFYQTAGVYYWDVDSGSQTANTSALMTNVMNLNQYGDLSVTGSVSGQNSYFDTVNPLTSTLQINTTGAGNTIIGATGTGYTTTFNDDFIRATSLTASQAVFTDASKNLVSKATTGTGNVVLNSNPTFATNITVNGLSVGRGDGNIATNTAYGFDAVGSSYITSGNINNVGIGYNSLNNIGAGVATVTQLTAGSGYDSGYDGSNASLVYVSGTPIIAGGTAPIAFVGINGDGTINSVSISSIGYGWSALDTVFTLNNADLGGVGSGATFQIASLAPAVNNTAIGYNAGSTQKSGSNSVYVGYNTTGTGSNQVLLGSNLNETANNIVIIGDTNITNTTLRGNVTATQFTGIGSFTALTAGGALNLTGNSSSSASFATSTTGSSISIGTGLTGGSLSIGSTGQTGAINLGRSNSSGTINIGGTTGTGAITLGQSTASQTVNIATGANTSGTKTLNLGTSGGTGGTTAITIGTNAGTSTTTLNGKTSGRIVPRASTTTSSATPTINTDTTDIYGLTAQAVDITSFTTNLSGTPTDGQKLWIYIVGTAARAITWGASFEASTVALPTTTVTTNRLDVGFVWNAATSKWRCVAVA